MAGNSLKISKRPAGLAAVFASLLFGISLGHAQQGGPADICRGNPKCMELFQAAINLARVEQHAAALALLQTAYAKYPAPWLLVNIGRSQQKLGRLRAALSSYRQYLASLDTTNDPALAQRAQEYLAQAQAQIADVCESNPKCAELIELARNLSKTGQIEAALTLYQNAYAQFPVPWLLVNIGRAQQKLGQLQVAIITFRQYLASPDANEDQELSRIAQDYLFQAEADFEPPPAPLTPPPPPPPAALPPPPPRPLCSEESESTSGDPTKPCVRQKRNGFAIALGFATRRGVVQPDGLGLDPATSLGGSIFLGYKRNRVIFGVQAEVDSFASSTQLVSAAGMATVTTRATSYLLSPLLQVALVRVLSGQLELLASAQIGFGQVSTSQTFSPELPSTVAADFPRSNFHLNVQVGPGLRHFLSQRLALTLLCGLSGDVLWVTQDSPSGTRADQLSSLSVFGALNALAVF